MMRSRVRPITIAAVVVVVTMVLVRYGPGWYWTLRSDNAVRRGADLAQRAGCLSCHAAPTGEPSNPGSRWGAVPSFFGGNTMMYVRSTDEVISWITNGRPRPSATPAPTESGAPPFTMKPFQTTLSPGEIHDLAAFVLAADAVLAAPPEDAAHGATLARNFACQSCHGVGGAGGVANPGSFIGTVPGFVGPAFLHLVRNEREFAEWVRTGRSRRFRDSRLASYFLNRANLTMPAFGPALTQKDIDDLWTYVSWLRSEPFERLLDK